MRSGSRMATRCFAEQSQSIPLLLRRLPGVPALPRASGPSRRTRRNGRRTSCAQLRDVRSRGGMHRCRATDSQRNAPVVRHLLQNAARKHVDPRSAFHWNAARSTSRCTHGYGSRPNIRQGARRSHGKIRGRWPSQRLDGLPDWNHCTRSPSSAGLEARRSSVATSVLPQRDRCSSVPRNDPRSRRAGSAAGEMRTESNGQIAHAAAW